MDKKRLKASIEFCRLLKQRPLVKLKIHANLIPAWSAHIDKFTEVFKDYGNVTDKMGITHINAGSETYLSHWFVFYGLLWQAQAKIESHEGKVRLRYWDRMEVDGSTVWVDSQIGVLYLEEEYQIETLAKFQRLCHSRFLELPWSTRLWLKIKHKYWRDFK